MKLIECDRRVPAPGGASPRGPIFHQVAGEFSKEFRDHAGRVLSRRNRLMLAAAQAVGFQGSRSKTQMKRAGQRIALQLVLLVEGGSR